MVDCPPEKLYLQLDDTPQLRIACAIDHLGRIDAEPSEVELRELGEHISEASTSAGDCDESELLVRDWDAHLPTFADAISGQILHCCWEYLSANCALSQPAP